MSHGIYLSTGRPKSKKAVKEAADRDPSMVVLEGTSLFSGEYSGPASHMPENTSISFVGPDPYTSRKFFGTIVRIGDKVTVK